MQGQIKLNGVILFALLSVVRSACATPGGEPFVLDTETGIHSGVPGTVLQTAPLGSSGMVQMQTLPELQPQGQQQPIVVSPYVEYGGQTTSAPSSGNGYGGRNRPRAPSGQ